MHPILGCLGPSPAAAPDSIPTNVPPGSCVKIQGFFPSPLAYQRPVETCRTLTWSKHWFCALVFYNDFIFDFLKAAVDRTQAVA